MRDGRAAAIGWSASAVLHSSVAALAMMAADYAAPPTFSGRSNVASIDLVATVASAPQAASDPALEMPLEPAPMRRVEVAAADEMAHEHREPLAHESTLAELPRQASASPTPSAVAHDAAHGAASFAAPQSARVNAAELPSRREPDVDVVPPAAKPLPKQSAPSVEIAAAASVDFGLETVLPEPLDNAPPEYPREALARGWQGTVMLRLRVSRQGTIDAIEVTRSSGHVVLDTAAAAAIGQWRFRPARQGDEPREAVILVPVIFRLPTR